MQPSNNLENYTLINAPIFPAIEEGFLPENAIVHFNFAPHTTDYHFDGAKELLSKADVYIPEGRGWTFKYLDVMNAISAGKEAKYRQARTAIESQLGETARYNLAQLDSIYQSRVPIICIDGSLKELGEPQFNFPLEYEPDFASIAKTQLKMAELIARESIYRDTLMVGNLGHQLWKLYRKNAGLMEKDTVNVLCTLGPNHSPIYEYLSSQDHAKDQVSASMWIGSNAAAEFSLTSFYRRGMQPDSRAIAASVIEPLLNLPVVSRVLGTNVRSNLLAHYSDQTPAAEQLGNKMLLLMLDDIENPRLQNTISRLVNGDALPGHKALLRKYFEKAKTMLELR